MPNALSAAFVLGRAQDALRAYLLKRCPGSSEVVDALFHVALSISRAHLRTKELLETVEAVRHAGAAIDESRRRRRPGAGTYKGKKKGGKAADRLPGPTAVYDLACGTWVDRHIIIIILVITWC
jgi:hypothetical protein